MQTLSEIRTAANRLYCDEFLAAQVDPERAHRLNEAMEAAVAQADALLRKSH